MLGTLRCVLFAPEDLTVVKGDPDQRRRLPGRPAGGDRAAVRRGPRRLRAGGPAADRAAQVGAGPRRRPPAALDVWDEQLVEAGRELTAGRLDLVTAIRPLAAKAYAAVSGDDGTAEMAYRQPDAGPVRAAGRRGRAARGDARRAGDRRTAELERGVCLVGPHRDELELRIGELPARGYASHGESWSLALALRLAAFDLLRSGGEDPVLILDDVFAELDAGRRDRLAGLVRDAEQVLVTAAVPADVPAQLSGARFDVAGGRVSRA